MPYLLAVKRKTENHEVFRYATRFINTGVLLVLTSVLVSQVNTAFATQSQDAAADPAVAAFNERVKQYVKLRKKAEGLPPKLSKKSQPEAIEANLATLQASISSARPDAKPGDLFTSDIAQYIRRAIRREFKGERLRKLRETIREADAKGVPMRVNVPYPETKELIEMPPTLLLNLPVLPKELNYRFVGGFLLLVDKDARLIVDYMAGAVPRPATSKR
ncbi:MAG TPA: hypothetical protein VK747_02660 [Blastocatellia bacterium]|nr:hypothetical protein [Blastocatellia bacterium]